MSEATIYDINGKILRTVSAPIEMIDAQKQENEFLIYGNSSIANQYVKDNQIIDKMVQNTTFDKLIVNADGVDVITINNAPSGEITIYNSAAKVGSISNISNNDTFATTIPGIYKVKIEAFPYLDFETTVEAI